MLKIMDISETLTEFLPDDVLEDPEQKLVTMKTIQHADLPALRISQVVERRYLVPLTRLAAWIGMISRGQGQIAGAVMDTDCGAIEVLILFSTDVEREIFLNNATTDLFRVRRAE
jgi:hypothetical protein